MSKHSFSVILRSENKLSGYNNNPRFEVNFSKLIPASTGKKYRLTSNFFNLPYDNYDDIVVSGVTYRKQQCEVCINLLSPCNQSDTEANSNLLTLGFAERKYTTNATTTDISFFRYDFNESIPCVVDGSVSLTQFLQVHIFNPAPQYNSNTTYCGKVYMLASDDTHINDVANTFSDFILVLYFEEI